MNVAKAKRYELECHHEVWFKIAPTADGSIWCAACHEYRRLLAATMSIGAWTYFPEWDFKSRKVKRNVYDARCTFGAGEKMCNWRLDKIWGFNIVRNLMHSHYMREHTNRGIEIHYVDHVEYTEPPF